MPTHDGVRVHDDKGGAPILPRVGEQHPKQSISVAELRTPHGALEHGQLLMECQILERDRSVSTADQREYRSATTSAASMSYPVPRSATESTGAGDLILANDRGCMVVRCIANSCCRGAKFSRTSSRCPRSPSANARPMAINSRSMSRSWLAWAPESTRTSFGEGQGLADWFVLETRRGRLTGGSECDARGALRICARD